MKTHRINWNGRWLLIGIDGSATMEGFTTSQGRYFPQAPCRARQDKDGYLRVTAQVNGVTHRTGLSRLVAQAFLPAFRSDNVVDHIDGNVQNNCVTNLRCITNSQNLRSHAKKRRGTTSQYRGVSWRKREKLWRATATNQAGKAIEKYAKTEKEALDLRTKMVQEFGYNSEAIQQHT